jgi:5'-3' exonuclease
MQLKGDGAILEPNLLRHMILNSIRRINREFGKKYGRLVICTDADSYWRKSVFKNYKANRKKSRDSSGIDWTMFFDTLGQLQDEIRDYFPYKVMDVPLAEADDIIAVITKYYKQVEPILIVSSDKDFIQLLDHNVSIYRPAQDELVMFSPSDLVATPQSSDDPLYFDLLLNSEEE